MGEPSWSWCAAKSYQKGSIRYLLHPNSAKNPVMFLVITVMKSVQGPILSHMRGQKMGNIQSDEWKLSLFFYTTKCQILVAKNVNSWKTKTTLFGNEIVLFKEHFHKT